MKQLIIPGVLLLLISSIDLTSQVLEQWVRRYNGPVNGNDGAYSIAIDGVGNIYVTGFSLNSAVTGTTDYVTIKYNPVGFQLWVQTYNGPGNADDMARSIAVDATGNVYVTGYSAGNGTSFDYATIKYNTFGVQQWAVRYNGPGNADDASRTIATDASGNVYVTGYSTGNGTNADYAVIKYNSAGVQQWAARYNGPGSGNDLARSIAVDASGNVYVTGTIYGGVTYSFAYATIKYNSSGVQQWIALYNGPENSFDGAFSLAIEPSGNVYVTGESRGNGTQYDYATIKYNSSGVQQWAARYNGPGNSNDHAYSIKIDGLGNVYVTGGSNGGVATYYDYATIKYNSSGVQQWAARYNSPANGLDVAHSLITDVSNNVYVTGESIGSATDTDYATIKYNSSGVQQWSVRYNGPGNDDDAAHSIAVDASSNIYITGYSTGNQTNYDAATVKYIQALSTPSNLTATVFSSSRINLNWIDNSDNELGFKVERSTTAGANWIHRDSVARNITVYADSGLMANTTYHYRVYAYNINGNSAYSNIAFASTFPTGINNNGTVPEKFVLYHNYPNPFNPTTKIGFDIPSIVKPETSSVKLIVLDILGREIATLVNEQLSPGTYEVEWPAPSGDASNYPSGVYYYQLTVRQAGSLTGDFTETKKMVLVK
jgi:uncharacterized delta-60 repeat protein